MNPMLNNSQSPVSKPDNSNFLNPEKIAALFGIQEGMKVSDFGSGAGYFTMVLARIVGPSGLVTAVDVLNSALETIRAKAGALGLNNVNTVRSDLEVLGGSGLAEGSQDFILLANILFQSSKKENIFQEAWRVLKSGGLLVVVDWQKGERDLGPPDDFRTDKETMHQLGSQASFQFIDHIDSGPFHYGLKFKKV